MTFSDKAAIKTIERTPAAFYLESHFFAAICKARESYTRNDGVIIIFGQKLAERDAKVLSHYSKAKIL